VANRIGTVNGSNAYAYDPANGRVDYRTSAGAETLYIYGKDGKKLATYAIAGISHGVVDFTQQSQNVYFAGRLISAKGKAVAVDALGTVRWNSSLGASEYYPYGVEFSPTANDTEKYATYTRDSVTGLDYAVNRYYASQWGRFLSPDSYAGSVSAGNPQSWNRYAYVGGDPTHSVDPSGLYLEPGGGGGGWGGGGGIVFHYSAPRAILG
jgi:RHS repeat-associated protein